MAHPVDVWTGMNDVRTSTEMSEFRPEMSEFRQEKILTKDIFPQRYGSDLGFSLDAISLLVSQFDLQNKKYCIRLQLVVAFGLGIRSVVAPESGVFVQGSIFFLLYWVSMLPSIAM